MQKSINRSRTVTSSLAIDNLRKSGQAKAAKKAGNIAADGAITIVQEGNKAILVRS